MPENFPVHGRLDSWKEIADYLKRDVRTAIRWGKDRGMPVHRVPGGKRQAVFAFKEEIDAWLVSQKHQESGLDISSKPAEPVAESSAAAKRDPDTAIPGPADVLRSPSGPVPWTVRNVAANRRRSLLVGLCLAALVAILILLLARPRSAAEVHLDSFNQLTDDGEAKGALRTDGKTLYFGERIGASNVLASAPVNGKPVRRIEVPLPNVLLEDLSSDGTRLLIKSVEGIAPEGSLWTIPAVGGTPERVGAVTCFAARWSPDNRKIACASGTSIILLNAKGSTESAIGPFSFPVESPVWTPDGTRLRFLLNNTRVEVVSQWEIPVNAEGNAAKARQLPLSTTCCAHWDWTSDGTTFIYSELDANGNTHLMLRREDNLLAGATELPVRIGSVQGFVPGKTKNLLYVVIDKGPRGELLKFQAGRDLPEPFLPGLNACFLSYSPDRRWITFVSKDGALWTSRADGSEPLQLSKPSMHVEINSWSPDGKRIAFMGQEPGKPFRIYLVDRNGGHLEELSESTDNQGGPSWAPDGKTIAYGNVRAEQTQDGWIRRVDLATRKVEIVPGSRNLRTARWSPDGKYIAAINWQARELMLFDVHAGHWRTLADSINGDNLSWASDSQSLFVDCLGCGPPVVERIRVRDGRRKVVAHLDPILKVPGEVVWFGLTPTNDVIVHHAADASEVYALNWTNH